MPIMTPTTKNYHRAIRFGFTIGTVIVLVLFILASFYAEKWWLGLICPCSDP